MKRLVITLGLLLVVLIGYTQVTNVAEYRVAEATTQFGVNLPVGTKVYDIANDKYYVVTTGLASTSTLEDAINAGSVTLLNDAGSDDQTATEVSVSATGNISSTNVQAALEELQGDIDGITVTDDQTLSIDSTGRVFTLTLEDGGSVNFEDTNTQLTESEVDNFVSDNGYLTEEVDGSTTNEIQDLSGSGSTLSGYVIALSDDGTSVTLPNEADGSATNEIQTLDVAQLNGANLELSLSSDGEATHQIDLSSLAGADDQNASEVDITDDGTYYSGTTVEVALQEAGASIATNESDISTNTLDISTLEAIAKTTTATITIGSTVSYTHSLAGLVASEGCVVAINGAVIEPNKYTLTSENIEIKSTLTTLYEYDQVVVTYKSAL